jgi:hypothetical protein
MTDNLTPEDVIALLACAESVGQPNIERAQSFVRALSAEVASLRAENDHLRDVKCIKVPTDTMEQEIQGHIVRATKCLKAELDECYRYILHAHDESEFSGPSHIPAPPKVLVVRAKAELRSKP